MHFSDAHYDILYKEGATVDCDSGYSSYCCRETTETGYGSRKAGKFGALNSHCDVPPITVQAVLDKVKSMNGDYLFWTGDSTPHDEATTNAEEVFQTMVAISEMV